jgi:hypothetical protein
MISFFRARGLDRAAELDVLPGVERRPVELRTIRQHFLQLRNGPARPVGGHADLFTTAQVFAPYLINC